MTLKKIVGSGGSTYLKTDDLTNHQSGKITKPPYLDENSGLTDDKGKPKSVYRIPMEVENMDGEILWSPGANAMNFLIDKLGDDETKWPDARGYFERREIQTIRGKKKAWFFVPNARTEPQAKASKGFTCRACHQVFPTVLDLNNHDCPAEK